MRLARLNNRSTSVLARNGVGSSRTSNPLLSSIFHLDQRVVWIGTSKRGRVFCFGGSWFGPEDRSRPFSCHPWHAEWPGGRGNQYPLLRPLPADPGRDQILPKALWSRGSPLSTKYTIRDFRQSSLTRRFSRTVNEGISARSWLDEADSKLTVIARGATVSARVLRRWRAGSRRLARSNRPGP